MKITRREAIKKAEAQTAVPGMCPLDYGRSFICNTAGFNAVRFWVESRTRIFDEAAGSVTDYYQCGACKSENTFAERDLFMARNYDFLPILGGGHWLIFRRPAGLSDTYRMIKPPDKMWGEPVLKLQEAPQATVLDRWERRRPSPGDPDRDRSCRDGPARHYRVPVQDHERQRRQTALSGGHRPGGVSRPRQKT